MDARHFTRDRLVVMASGSEPRAWVLPAEPVPVRLMNTIWADTSGIHDDLVTTADDRDRLLATEVSDELLPVAVHNLNGHDCSAMPCDASPGFSLTTPGKPLIPPSPTSTRR